MILSSKRSRRLVRIVLVALVPLLLVEVLLRLVGPHVPAVAPLLYHSKTVHAYDDVETLEELMDLSVLGFRPRTRRGDFVLNSKGFLTTEYATEKRPGTRRILAIGDSFTFSCGGLPHREMWHYRLGEELRRSGGDDVEVLNLGVPAVGPDFALRLWQLEGSQLDADLVVLAFVVSSNFAASKAGKQRRDWLDRVSLASFTVRFVCNGLRLRASRAEKREPRGRAREREPQAVGGVPVEHIDPQYRQNYDPHKPFLSDDRFITIAKRYWIAAAKEHSEFWEPVGETLVRFRNEVEAAGVEFVVMVIPSEIQTNPALRERVLSMRDKRGLPDADLQLDAQQRFLRELFEREGIRYLDLLPAFLAADPEVRYFGANNTHWNSEGNALAAGELLRFLEESADSDR